MNRLALVSSLCLAACAPKANSPPPEPRPDTYIAVVDGQTLRIRGRIYRIAEISTPSLAPTAKCWAEAALALKSAEQLQELVHHAKIAPVVQEVGKDADGATLASIELGGYDVANHLIHMGVAAPGFADGDWCGQADFAADGGPSLGEGPQANAKYLRWLAERSAQRDPYVNPSAPAR